MITFEEFRDSIVVPEVKPEKCMVTSALEIFQGKWSAFVLFELIKKSPLRFGEIKKELPQITNTMLTSTLRDLEIKGLVNRIQFNEIPPHTEYSLTKRGEQLYVVYYVLQEWAMKYGGED